MLLTLTTTHAPATDLGYLLAKNPARCQTFDLAFGQAHVFYSEAAAERCTAALLVEVDPVGLVRGPGAGLDQYVNDRPYAATSFLSVAIARVFGSALGGRSRERPDLAATPIPLTARVAALPCRGGEAFLRHLFEPLGYAVTATRLPLDPHFPDWGDSRYFHVELAGTVRLHELLSHLYVLVPVLDDDKHYWVGPDEVTKLLRAGDGWLAGHPRRDDIARRYLRHKPALTRAALARLADDDAAPDAVDHDRAERTLEKPIRLNQLRLETVARELKQSGATRVLDLGCGEGRLLRMLADEPQFREIVGLDVSARALLIAGRRVGLPYRHAERVRLLHGSLTYRDRRLTGFDAASLVEVVEHLDPPRLAAFERAVFEIARPRTVVLTTPNAEFNVRFAGMSPGQPRHPDHRFEWTRAEFRQWAEGVAAKFGYAVRIEGIGIGDAEVGSPTQLGVFTR